MSSKMKTTRYRDDSGYLVFVSSGISGGAAWMTVRQKKPHSGTHRIVSPRLPLRSTPGGPAGFGRLRQEQRLVSRFDIRVPLL